MISYFDFHCDTPFELYRRGAPLGQNDLHIALDRAHGLDRWVQTAAIWSDRRLSDDDAFAQFLCIADDFKTKAASCGVPLAKGALSDAPRQFLLAVEDARLLGGDLSRMDVLSGAGVRVLTLVWAGDGCIGGAHDTDGGLSPFGKEVVLRCFETGIVPDLSHASDRMIDEVLDLAAVHHRPVVATHSNARAVYAHRRNLRDEHFRAIVASGGLVGLSFAPQHLAESGADLHAILRHAQHDLSLGGEDALVFGGDFDGIETTPQGLSSIADIPALYDLFERELGNRALCEKIFYQNGIRFWERIGTANA